MTRRKNKKQTNPCHICYSAVKSMISPCGCSICAYCWSQMIHTKIQETNSVSEMMTCPRENCQQTFSTTTLSNKFPKTIQEELSQATLKVYLSKTPDIRQCPSTKCNYAGIIDTKSSCSESLQCKACGTTWRDKIHHNSIEKIQDSFSQMIKQRNEVFSELWKRMRTRKCPSCKVSIDKNGGCDHMTCAKCHFQFCWACLQTYGHPGHNQSRHNFEAQTKPMIFGLLMLLAFLLMLYALYLVPPINFAIHATIVPAAQWCWGSIITPIFNAISSVFGPPIKFCWPYIKAFFKWAGYNVFTGILLNLIFYNTFVIMMKLTKNPCPAQISKKASFAIIIVCVGLTYYTQVYEQMLKIGILEAFILLCLYLKFRLTSVKKPQIHQRWKCNC